MLTEGLTKSVIKKQKSKKRPNGPPPSPKDAKEIVTEFGYTGKHSQVLVNYLAAIIGYLLLRGEAEIVFKAANGDEVLKLRQVDTNKFEVEMPSPINEMDYFINLFSQKESVKVKA